jgi:hypothetical protein
MIKISDLEHIQDNLEILGYNVENTKTLFIYMKENNRFHVDIEMEEVRFYMKTKTWNLQKTFTFSEFVILTHDWIKKHKLK